MALASAKVPLVDSHAHLHFDQFKNDRQQVIQNARLAGITTIINIGTDLRTSQQSVSLAENYDFIFAAVGVHPNDSPRMQPNLWEKLKSLYQHDKVVAIGEIGLDYYRNVARSAVQKAALIRQLEWAVELDLPVVIHARQAWGDILTILAGDFRHKVRGVFHCFSGLEEEARLVLNLGFYISFTGVVTFKNSQALRVAAEFVPLDRLLLETDCPFMAPVPYRGQRNEPAYVPILAEKIAEAKRINLADLARQTNENVKNLFGIEISSVSKIRH